MTVSDGICSKCKKYRTLITETINGDKYICSECIEEKTVATESTIPDDNDWKISSIPQFHASGIVPDTETLIMLHGCEPIIPLYPFMAHLFGIYVFDRHFLKTYRQIQLPDLKLDMHDYVISIDELWLTGPETKKRMESNTVENTDDSEDIFGLEPFLEPQNLWQKIKKYLHNRKYPPYVNLNLPNDTDSKIDEYSKELKDWTEHAMGEKGSTEDSFTHVIRPFGTPNPLDFDLLKEISDNNKMIQIAVKAKIDHIPESRWQRIKKWWSNRKKITCAKCGEKYTREHSKDICYLMHDKMDHTCLVCPYCRSFSIEIVIGDD